MSSLPGSQQRAAQDRSGPGSLPFAAPGRPLALPLAALGLALLVLFSPWQQRGSDLLNDVLLRWATPQPALGAVLVIDIDDASLADLQPQLGPWPYRRDVHALTVDYLREAGATVIGFDIVFNDAREGDAALAAAIARPGAPVVLAAAGLRQAADAEQVPTLPAAMLAGLPSLAPPAMRWPSLTGPGAALLAGVTHGAPVGLITTPLSDDGKLRRVPLLHHVQDQWLPAFSLALLLATAGDVRLGFDAQQRSFGDGRRQWPVDAQGLATLRFAAIPRPSVDRLRYSELAQAMLGRSDGQRLRERVRGRAVLIGSSAFFGDGVMTAEGQINGTELLAGVYAALRDGRLLRPPRPALDSAVLALALLPAVLAWRRPQPALGRDLRSAAAMAGGLLLLALGLLAWQQQLVQLAAPLVALLAGAVAAAWSQHRWMRRAHRQLAYQRSVAEAASRAKSDFLANVSHEIRTPMNALLGVAELLAETSLDNEQRRHVAVFRRAGETLFALVNDLLDLTKIEAGRLELRPEVFVLRDLLDDQLALLRPLAEDKGLALLLEAAPDLPAWVLGDRQRLAQCLLNLLGNAIKFTRSGQVLLRVAPAGGPLLAFAVEDSGVGIAPSKLESVFQPFVQADDSPLRHYGGTGLGLSISRSLARLMGGDVTLTSQPGQGSRFVLTARLPAAQPAPAQASVAAQAGADAVVPLRLLLADDNPANVYIVQAMLRADRHHIEVVGDGLLAVERVRASAWDIVLMDVQMPGMDGLSATREIRRIEAALGRAPVPVVIVSAHAYADDALRSRQAGASEHLAKPLSRRRLREAIARHRPATPVAAPLPDIALDIALDTATHCPHASHPDPQAGAASPAWFAAIDADELVDAQAALHRLQGDLALYRGVLDHAMIFLTTWSRSFRNACSSDDRPLASRLTHDLKGVAATIGATGLAEAAQGYELQLRQGLAPGQGPPLDEVEQALRPVLVLLAAALSSG